ncbi:MAG: SRPBCC domain-containing protein [Chloroflexi bacterium]|nr:SRPBCC domain-containing protein [Chloroflexota bacterium]
MKYEGKVTLTAAPLHVWDYLLDVEKFSACMPGVENLKRIDDSTFDGTMRAKVGPMSGNFDFRAQIVESEPPTQLTARVEGTDSMTKSTMTSDITMALAPLGDGQTELTYKSVVDIHGRLAIIGDMVIRATGAQVIKEFFKRLAANIEGEAA